MTAPAGRAIVAAPRSRSARRAASCRAPPTSARAARPRSPRPRAAAVASAPGVAPLPSPPPARCSGGDRVEPPLLLDALERMHPAVLEGEARARDEVAD